MMEINQDRATGLREKNHFRNAVNLLVTSLGNLIPISSYGV